MAKSKASKANTKKGSTTSSAANVGEGVVSNKGVVAKKAASKPKKKSADAIAVYVDDRGLKFRFKKSAPATLNFDGKTQKITDIIKSEEIMLELVYGNSNHIEQIH